MAGAIAHRNTEVSLGEMLFAPLAPGIDVFGGTLIAFDLEKGGCLPASNRRGTIFVGVSLANVSNRQGGLSGVEVALQRRGRFLFNMAEPILSGVQEQTTGVQEQTKQGVRNIISSGLFPRIMIAQYLFRRVYAIDDCTVTISDSGPEGPWVGNIVGFTAGGVWVEIDGAVAEGRKT